MEQKDQSCSCCYSCCSFWMSCFQCETHYVVPREMLYIIQRSTVKVLLRTQNIAVRSQLKCKAIYSLSQQYLALFLSTCNNRNMFFLSICIHKGVNSVCLADMIELNEAFPCMMKEAPSSFLPWFLIMLNILLGLCKRARICKPLKEPRIRFPAWRAGATTLFIVQLPVRLHRLAESIPGLLRRLQIRAQSRGGT
jgi:hypothetical protein